MFLILNTNLSLQIFHMHIFGYKIIVYMRFNSVSEGVLPSLVVIDHLLLNGGAQVAGVKCFGSEPFCLE